MWMLWFMILHPIRLGCACSSRLNFLVVIYHIQDMYHQILLVRPQCNLKLIKTILKVFKSTFLLKSSKEYKKQKLSTSDIVVVQTFLQCETASIETTQC